MPDDDDPRDHHDPHSLLSDHRVKIAQKYWWVLVAVGTVAASIASTATQFANYASRNEQTIADLVIARSTALNLAARVENVAQTVHDNQAGLAAENEHFQRVEGVLKALTDRADRSRDDLALVKEGIAAEHERLGFLYDRVAGAPLKPAARKW